MKRIPCKPERAAAIRAGRNTETRRLLSPQPDRDYEGFPYWSGAGFRLRSTSSNPLKPKYAPGEIVGIVEPWCVAGCFDGLSGAEIIARHPDFEPAEVWMLADGPKPANYGRTRLARFLPDAFVRTTVRIGTVEAQRVQEITVEQARDEGCGTKAIPWRATGRTPHPWVDTFADLWDSIHGAEAPWESNPWVWRYVFELEEAR